MSAPFDLFSRRLLRAVTDWSANWVILSRVDSTNDLARRVIVRCADAGREPPESVFVAWQQEAGRGRGKNTWSSPAGKGVYASLLVPCLDRFHLPHLPLALGVGLAAALESRTGLPIELKWPNDLVLSGRKIGGILVETKGRSGERADTVIGFGINYAHDKRDLPWEEATSIALEIPRPPDLVELTLALIKSVGRAVKELGDRARWLDLYRIRSLHQEGDSLTCRTPGGVVTGTFLGFDPDGFLLLQCEGTVRRIPAGELVKDEQEESESEADER